MPTTKKTASTEAKTTKKSATKKTPATTEKDTTVKSATKKSSATKKESWSKATVKKVATKTVSTTVASDSTSSVFTRHERDTGSPEKQIWNLTAEITMLQWHLAKNHKDYDAKRSLFKKVARRRAFLRYLKQNDLEIYQSLSKKLNMKV